MHAVSLRGQRSRKEPRSDPALGETLRAEIEVTSITPEEASSLRLRVAPPEAYRAAGVDYNAALSSARLDVVQRPDGRSVVRITGDRALASHVRGDGSASDPRRWFSGSIEVPLRVVRMSGASPIRRWRQ